MSGFSSAHESPSAQYTDFAYLYDIFMDNIPYEDWCSYLTSLLRDYGIENGLVAELGCGTGAMTMLLANAGYDMIGIDNSSDMLDVAREKLYECLEDEEAEPPILYLEQDMREFELFGTVAAIVSVCDSMNYILNEEDLLQVFRLVNNYLDSEGIFIFDLKTEYFYQYVMGNKTFTDVREDCVMIWENEYDSSTHINTYNLTLFSEEENKTYYRCEECHKQYAYSLLQIQSLLEQAGMEYVTAYDAFTRNTPHEKSERIYVIAREKKHEGKLYF